VLRVAAGFVSFVEAACLPLAAAPASAFVALAGLPAAALRPRPGSDTLGILIRGVLISGMRRHRSPPPGTPATYHCASV
jgi:hypothetical protein